MRGEKRKREKKRGERRERGERGGGVFVVFRGVVFEGS